MAAWEFEEGCTVWFNYRDGEINVPYEEEFIDYSQTFGRKAPSKRFRRRKRDDLTASLKTGADYD